MQVLVAFSAILVVVSSTAVRYKDCAGHSRSTIHSVDVTPCSDPTNCHLIRGQHANITVKFTANEDTNSVHTKVYGILLIPIPFYGVEANPCDHNQLTCPIVTGNSYTFNSAVYVEPSYPSVSVLIKFELVDDHHHNMACFEFKAQIADS